MSCPFFLSLDEQNNMSEKSAMIVSQINNLYSKGFDFLIMTSMIGTQECMKEIIEHFKKIQPECFKEKLLNIIAPIFELKNS